MLRRRGCVALARAALGSLAALAGCRSPTQIDVVVTTNVDCARVSGTAVTSGELGAIESAPATATTTACAGERIGSVVLVPSGDEGALVAFKVVTAINGANVETCTPGDGGVYGPNCIVARRALRYLPHTSLAVQVLMSGACAGQACNPETTCVEGACVPATITNPAQCEGAGCTEQALAPDGGVEGSDATVPADAAPDGPVLDATVEDSTVADSNIPDSTIADSAIEDATVDTAIADAPSEGAPIDSTAEDASIPDATVVDARVDAGLEAGLDAAIADAQPFDAGPFDAAVPGCDLGGLQQGAAWPMESYCPSGRNRSPLVGPSSMPSHKWGINLVGGAAASPSVGSDGTVYVGSLGGVVSALHPADGGALWTYAPDAGAAFWTMPVLASDRTVRVFDYSQASPFTELNLDGSVRLTGDTYPVRGGVTVVSGGTTYVADNSAHLLALDPSGVSLWSIPGVANDNVFPSVGGGGTIFTNDSVSRVFALRPDGGQKWGVAYDGGAMSTPQVAVDGSLRSFSNDDYLYSLDPATGGVNWRVQVVPGTGNIVGMAIGDNGTTYVGTQSGLFAFDSSGGAAGNNQLTSVGEPIIDANGDLYAWAYGDSLASFDRASLGTRWKVQIPSFPGVVADTPVIGPGGIVYVVVTDSSTIGAIHAFGP